MDGGYVVMIGFWLTLKGVNCVLNLITAYEVFQ